MNKKYKFLLAGFMCFFLFSQTSQAGFFDWFRIWFGKNDSQINTTIIPNTEKYILAISKSGLGLVTSDDGKINCGKQCQASY